MIFFTIPISSKNIYLSSLPNSIILSSKQYTQLYQAIYQFATYFTLLAPIWSCCAIQLSGNIDGNVACKSFAELLEYPFLFSRLDDAPHKSINASDISEILLFDEDWLDIDGSFDSVLALFYSLPKTFCTSSVLFNFSLYLSLSACEETAC